MLATRLKKSLYIAIFLSSLCMMQILAEDEELTDELKGLLEKSPLEPPAVTNRHLGGPRDCHDDENYAKFCGSWKRYCGRNDNVNRFCKETCGLCGDDDCDDSYRWCGRYQRWCWHAGVVARCRRTCGECDEEEEDPCDLEPCQNGGECYVRGNSFRCRCTPGYTGSTCDKKKKTCKDKARNCSRRKWLCRWNSRVRNDCKKTCGQCKDDDSSNACDSDPCLNGGTCTKRGSGFTCKCTADHTGTTCDQRRSVDPCRNDPCENGGTCEPTSTSYTCDCRTGYTGRNCQTADPCYNEPCHNGGTCEKSGSSYTCDCPSGFTGRTCRTAINPCNSYPCKNGGTCRRSGSSFTCRCRAGYEGTYCEETVNACDSYPCQNGGTCEKSGSSYTCDCRTGYTGRNCQTAVNPCNSRPCQNGGTCQRRGTSYTCNCRSGYSGQNCDTVVEKCIDKSLLCPDYTDRCHLQWAINACKRTCNLCGGGGGCSGGPCKNGGTCNKDGTGYTCSCESGWTGSTCEVEINACDSNPCKNGGDCTKSGSEFTCSCTASWTGPTCKDAVGGGGSCFPNPCYNKGTCYKRGDVVKCKCTIGYTGNRCQTKLRIGVFSDCTQDCGGGTRYKGNSCASNDVTKCPRKYEDCNTHTCPQKHCTKYRFGVRSKCCTPSSGTCGIGGTRLKRIIGGTNSGQGQWPWMAALYYTRDNSYFCGGVVVSDRWIVSAGHCLSYYDANKIKVLVGAATRSSPEFGHAWYSGERKVIHPSYSDPVDDLALLKVTNTIVTSKYVMPLCFPNGERLDEDTVCFAAGWGIGRVEDIASRTPSNYLKHVGIRTMPLDTCVQAYKGTDYEEGVTSKVICSGLLGGGSDTCNGDSGGPLFCQRKGGSCEWYLAGITSFGATECGVGTLPGCYCDVVQYEAWIQGIISG